jgi:two-component system, response regulator YesN
LTSAVAGPYTAPGSTMYKALIVDDEYEIRHSLACYFPWGESGFVVAGQAQDGGEAREFVKANHVDLVLCDIKMPVLSGLEFARWVHEEGLPVKTVFLSAYRKFDFAQEALRYGVKRYLVKPPDFAAMAACLREIREELDGESQEAREGDPVVDAVIAYTAGNPADATLRGAARLVGMNPHYLSEYFKSGTGGTFSQHLTRIKMERAAVLLRDRRNTVLSVSDALGYASPKSFSRAFRTFHGASPRDFRHQRRA